MNVYDSVWKKHSVYRGVVVEKRVGRGTAGGSWSALSVGFDRLWEVKDYIDRMWENDPEMAREGS